MKLTHPDSKQSIDVDPKRAETYLSQGWVAKDTKAESSTKPPAK